MSPARISSHTFRKGRCTKKIAKATFFCYFCAYAFPNEQEENIVVDIKNKKNTFCFHKMYFVLI
jgi:hypothetical protein